MLIARESFAPFRLRLVACAALLAGSLGLASAQMNVAEITGGVKDASGAVVARATVTAVNSATKLKFVSMTDASGQYLLAQLPPGEYSVAAGAQGFKQAVQENLLVHAGQQVSLNFALVVGEQTEVLIVEEAPSLLETDSAQIKDEIPNQQVLELPVKDREFLELALLGAGVVNPPGGTRGDSLQQTGSLINILGQRTGHNLFLVDGVAVTDEYFNNVVLSPPPDDIREFNIAKTTYDAEFGGKSGGVINVITQSGTNRFHGSAYEFFRNNIFDARNFFDPAGRPAPPFRQNQFGGTFGGPIVKDSTFFFLNFDGQRIRDSLAQMFSVPTAAQRVGVFTTTILNPGAGIPFPNNTISLPLDPTAVALLARVPLPNLPGTANNLLAIGNQKIDNNQYNARLDRQFSPKDAAYARASVFDANEFDPFGSSVLNEALLPGFGRTLTTHSANVSAGETHALSANALNEFRFGGTRLRRQLQRGPFAVDDQI